MRKGKGEFLGRGGGGDTIRLGFWDGKHIRSGIG